MSIKLSFMCDKKTTKYSFDNLSLMKIINEYSDEEINFENYEEINIDELDFDYPVYSPDMVFKGKEDIRIYEFLSIGEDYNQLLSKLLACLTSLLVKFDLDDVIVKIIVPPDFDEELKVQFSRYNFFKPQQLTLKNVDGDKLLSDINDKVENTGELTLNECIKMSIVPLMGSKNTLNRQIVEVIKTIDKMGSFDFLVREQILNMQLLIMDKFGDINSEDQIVSVGDDDRKFLLVF